MTTAPKFWYRKPGLAATLLAPLGGIYAAGTARRIRRGAGFAPGVPVICVGNINVGGTGKTPTVIALLERLMARGRKPAVLSRGYGGSESGPHRVDERADDAARVGDEPLLLSAFASVWVARDRVKGARAAVEGGADVLIMDDGFQSGALTIDFALVVVDAARGFGNGRVLPAGPLREPVKRGLARADALLSIGGAGAQAGFDPGAVSLPHLRGALEPLQTGMEWAGLRALAFAGIGHPEKFFATLRALGVEVAEAQGFGDHTPYDRMMLTRLTRRAQELGARLVTTEKDAVRLPQDMRREVLAVPVRLQLDDWTVLDAAFARLGL